MSEQPSEDDSIQPYQPTEDELAFPALQLGTVWGASIAKQRAGTLESILQAWDTEDEHGGRRGPFDGVTLSGADAFWLAAQSLAGSIDATGIAAAQADLRKYLFLPPLVSAKATSEQRNQTGGKRAPKVENLHLEGANLRGADLPSAALAGAHLESAHLEGAYLMGADLTGAYLDNAHLEDAILAQANIEGATFSGAHLKGASFNFAYVNSARFNSADLKGATFVEASLNNA